MAENGPLGVQSVAAAIPRADAAGRLAPDPTAARLAAGGAIRLLRLLLIGSIVIPAGLFVGASWYGWRDTQAQATRQAQRVVELLREHALKMFETHEYAIDEIDERIRGLDWQTIASSPDIRAFLGRLLARHTQISAALLVDPAGHVASLSGDISPAAAANLARAADAAARAHGAETFVSAPAKEADTEEPAITVSRRRTTADGHFDGTIAVAIALNRFTSFYRGLSSADANSVTLARTDGAVLVREPPANTGATALTGNSGFMRSIKSGARTYRTVGELDEIERIHAIEPVGTYPLYVSYGASLRGIERTWLTDVAIYALFAAAAAIGLFSVTWLAIRRVRGEHAVITQWQKEMDLRKAAEDALHQNQKMEVLGQLTGGVAHDFNNILTVISGNIELLKRRAAGLGADKQVAAIEHAARQGETLTRQLLSFSRRRVTRSETVDTPQLTQRLVELIRPSLPNHIRIVADVPKDLWPIRVDTSEFELALLNIAVNARDAMDAGGILSLSVRNRTFDSAPGEELSGDFVAFAVTDNGTGIPEDVLARIFEPFFTTKAPGKGTGLGLSQVYGFATHCGGTVTVSSKAGHGTTVTLFLPRAPDNALPGSEPEPEPPAPLETSDRRRA